MKNVGTIIAIVGLVGIVYFGYEYYQASESFSVLGVDVTASTGDYVPIFLSGLVFLGGLVLRKYVK